MNSAMQTISAANSVPKSLESLMNDMVTRRDIIKTAQPEVLQRDDILMAADPLLASLHKEYMDVKAQHEKLFKTNGPDDAMVEVSADMVDSAQSAYQTRILELEEQAEGEGTEALKMRRRLRQIQAEKEASLARLMQKQKQEHEEEQDAFFWWVVMTWIAQQTFHTAKRTLSMSSAFARANLILGQAWQGAQRMA